MITAVIVSVGIMMVVGRGRSAPSSHQHPTVKMLALSLPAADRHVAGRRRLRPAHPEGLHLLRDGLLGVRGDDQPPAPEGSKPVHLHEPLRRGESPAGTPPGAPPRSPEADVMRLPAPRRGLLAQAARPRRARAPTTCRTRVRHAPRRVHRLRDDGRRRWRRPTSSSSASSTTIRTRIGWSRRCSRARAAARRRAVVSLEMFERDVQGRSTTTCRATSAKPQFLQGAPPMAALRHRLHAARRVGEARGVAGGRGQRAAPIRVGSREGRAGGASTSCCRPTAR